MPSSTITAKFQTTVPKKVRMSLGLEATDALEWRVEGGKAIVVPLHASFLRHRNAISVGQGEVTADLETARSARAEKHR